MYFPHYHCECTSLFGLCFECQSYADDFERVGAEHADHACETATYKSARWSFLVGAFDHARADLFVCEEFYAGVGEDPEEGCGVAFKEPAYTGRGVDVVHGSGET